MIEDKIKKKKYKIIPADKIEKENAVMLSIHVPKTAGTTFGKVLSAFYKKRFLCVYRSSDNPRLFTMGFTREEVLKNQESGNLVTLNTVFDFIVKNKILCVHGHLHSEDQSDLIAFFEKLGKKVMIVSFVREPIARAYSDLCHDKVFHKSNELTNVILKKKSNILVQCLKNILPVSHIFHSEDFNTEIRKLGLSWDEEKHNVNPEKDSVPYDEERIYLHNEKDVEFYEEILDRFPRLSYVNKKDMSKIRIRSLAISVKNVSKKFRIPHEKVTSVKQAVVNVFKKKSYEEFQALNDVSFEIKKGEFFGIIGRNGSGKSTLLKILAGVYSADKGDIAINGAISPFLELGIGFNPELSGRDNIYLNATVLGMTRKEIDEKFDAIVAFSELERFIDQKLKNYSSGMHVRLAFSVSIHANREILLMDEVLAVGDANFQSKCLNEFNRYRELGRTVVLVTHDISTVQRYCDRAMLLRDGAILKVGTVNDVCNAYVYQNMTDEEQRMFVKGKEIESKITQVAVTEVISEDKKIPHESILVKKMVEIVGLEFFDAYGTITNVVKTNDPFEMKVSFDALETMKDDINIGLSIESGDGHYIFGYNTEMDGCIPDLKKGFITLSFPRWILLKGEYAVNITIVRKHDSLLLDFIPRAKKFTVFCDGKENLYKGLVNTDHTWKQ